MAENILTQEKATASEDGLRQYEGLEVELTEDAREFLSWAEKHPRAAGRMPLIDVRESLGADAFDSLTLDRIHKQLLKGYDEWRPQWPNLISQWDRVTDFRTYYGILHGGMDRLPKVGEKMPYLENDFSDDQISYSVNKYGSLFGYSFEASTYDDLGLLDTRAQKLGAAAARTYEYFFFYTSLEAAGSAASYDGTNNVFGTIGSVDSAFLNTMTSTGLTTANIETGIEKMLAQTALDSSTTYTDMNYVPVQYIPKYLIVHTSELMNAIGILGSDKVAEDANNRINPIEANRSPNPIQNLQIIYTPYISSSHWYLMADPAMGANTMVAGIWQGQQGPEFFYETPNTGHNFGFDEIRMKIRQIFGGTLLDPKAWLAGST